MMPADVQKYGLKKSASPPLFAENVAENGRIVVKLDSL